jgi:hypothetical protein
MSVLGLRLPRGAALPGGAPGVGRGWKATAPPPWASPRWASACRARSTCAGPQQRGAARWRRDARWRWSSWPSSIVSVQLGRQRHGAAPSTARLAADARAASHARSLRRRLDRALALQRLRGDDRAALVHGASRCGPAMRHHALAAPACRRAS